jgi:hypothetical protein
VRSGKPDRTFPEEGREKTSKATKNLIHDGHKRMRFDGLVAIAPVKHPIPSRTRP